MIDKDKANPQKRDIADIKAKGPVESFNYLNLEDSIVTQNTTFYEENESKQESNQTGQRRISNGIIKVVHQISKYEEEEESNSEDGNSIDMTSQILAEEIFSPIVW
jgi:hypothetical protein